MAGLDERAKRIIESGKAHGETRFESVPGSAGRVISGRLLPGTDLLTGIKDFTLHHNIRAGAIMVAFGSLASGEVTWKEGSKPDPNMKNQRLHLEGPLSFLAGQGKVGISKEGEAFVHLHGVLSDLEGKTWGGHFHEGNNPVFSTFELVIMEIEGVRHTKVWDDESEVKLLKAVELK